MRLEKVDKSACEVKVPITVHFRDRTFYTIPLYLGRCQSCGTEVNTDNGYADLDGTPWKAYYCNRCVEGGKVC